MKISTCMDTYISVCLFLRRQTSAYFVVAAAAAIAAAS